MLGNYHPSLLACHSPITGVLSHFRGPVNGRDYKQNMTAEERKKTWTALLTACMHESKLNLFKVIFPHHKVGSFYWDLIVYFKNHIHKKQQ